MPKTKHPVVLLDTDRDEPVPEVVVYGRRVVLKLTGNIWVVIAATTLANVTTGLDALEAAEAKARDGGKGTAAARNGKLAATFADLEALRGAVQVAVDANPQAAAEIAESAGMVLRKVTRAQKQALAASMTSTPGMVKLVAKAVRRGASYEWQVSSDGGHTWAAAGTTTVADTLVPGLLAGTSYVFRVRMTVGHTTSDWIQMAPFLVH